ncbi:MAG: flagellar hook-basal body complex protein FliE [Gammaproteobacteria bacterium]|jgi:flagellar hook-basal body complex protein FliE
MSTIETEIGSVLAQIRELSQRIDSGPAKLQTPERGEGFSTAFREAIEAVNAHQRSAEVLTEKFQAGDPNTSIAEVVVEMQKASVSFQAMSEARNRIVDAYREIMNMSV